MSEGLAWQSWRMAVLGLTRVKDDRKLFELKGVGTLRDGGWRDGDKVAMTADGVEWECRGEGMLKRNYLATDPAGVVVGRYVGKTFGTGGAMEWGGASLALRKPSLWSSRWELVDQQLVLAEFQPKGRSARPMEVTLHAQGVPDGLLMFTVYVVQALVRAAAAASAGGDG